MPAIPNIALVDSCSEVPFNVTLNRLAVPFRLLVPVNVAVPADALKLPLTTREAPIEKLEAVLMLPLTDRPLKLIVPAPEIVFVLPLIVKVPALAVKLPLTDKLPVRVISVEVLTAPETVRLSNTIPVPVMVLVVPDKVVVPPAACVKEPGPLVARLPPIFRLLVAAAVMLEARKERLLKLWVPVPLMEVPPPVIFTVLVLPVKVPLLTQLPAMLCVKLPPLKVVEAPIETLPLTVILDAAVKLREVPAPRLLLRLPATVKSVAGMVFTTAPVLAERVRLP